MNSNDLTIREMCRLGRDVLENRDMQALRTFPQHGTVSRYEHCLAVCYIALRLADKWRVRVDRRSMVRGALLQGNVKATIVDSAGRRLLQEKAPGKFIILPLDGINATDEATQTDLYKQMETMLADTAANVYIQDLSDLVAMRQDLGGLKFYPIYVLDLSTVYLTQQ